MLPTMLRRDRLRWGMSEAQAARGLQVGLRTYRDIEAGTAYSDFASYDAICKLFGWPQAFVAPGGQVAYQ